MKHLFQAVYEDPDSDDKRLALAEALSAAGDPRGELIQLQFARAEGRPFDAKREAALIKKHAKEWIGLLAPVTVRSSLVFEKGFLSAATFQLKKAADAEAALGAPEWATVRVLERSGFRAIPASLVLHPVMRSLLAIGVRLADVAGPHAPVPSAARMSPPDALDPISPAQAAPLFDGPPTRPLVALFLYRPKEEPFTDSIASSLAKVLALPRLRHLQLALDGPPEMYRWFFGSQLEKQIEVALFDLNNFQGQRPLGEWLAQLETRAPRFLQCGFELRPSRDADGRWSILDVDARADTYHPSPRIQNLIWLLQGLPRDLLTGFRLHLELGDLAPLKAELATHTRLRDY